MTPSPGPARIAFVYGDFPPARGDGGSDFLRHLAEGLVGRGHEVTAIVSRRDDRPSGFVSQGGVHVEPVIGDWTLRGAASGQLRALRQALDASRAEIVHLIYPDPFLRYGTDSYHLPFLIKPAANRPLVVTFFGFGVTGASLISKTGLFALFAAADRVVITDAELLRRFRRTLPWWAEKARGGLVGSIGETTSPAWSQAELAGRKAAVGLRTTQRHIGFFGFWSPDKGLENLLEALGRLRKDGHDAVLVLIGGRPADERFEYEKGVLRLAEELGLAESVIETGSLAAEEVSRYMVAMDVCALPFKVNPLGRSSLALALGLGLPTVVTKPVENASILDGLALLEIPEPDRIAAALARLLNDPAAQQAVADAARRAAANWSWPSIVGDYEQLYADVLARRAR